MSYYSNVSLLQEAVSLLFIHRCCAFHVRMETPTHTRKNNKQVFNHKKKHSKHYTMNKHRERCTGLNLNCEPLIKSKQ